MPPTTPPEGAQKGARDLANQIGLLQGQNHKGTQKAWTGDIAGRRIRAKSAPARTKNVYPQYGRYTNNPSRTPKPTQRSVSNKSTLARLKKLQTPARAHKFYPQQNRYVSNHSKTPRSTQNPSSNRGTLSRLKKLQSSPPRVYRKSINVYANFRTAQTQSRKALSERYLWQTSSQKKL